MLENWLSSLSRTTIVTISLVGGIFLVVLINPPHTVCHTQKEVFMGAVGKDFFIDAKKKKLFTRSRFERHMASCKVANSFGGCYEFIKSLKLLEREVEASPKSCVSQFTAIKEIKKAFIDGVELMVTLAWGETPPETFMERSGWLSQGDLALFCRLKKTMGVAYGKQKWGQLREQLFKKLPGAEKFSRKDIWQRSLFSTQCKALL